MPAANASDSVFSAFGGSSSVFSSTSSEAVAIYAASFFAASPSIGKPSRSRES